MRSLFRSALCRGAPPEDGLASLTLTRTLTRTRTQTPTTTLTLTVTLALTRYAHELDPRKRCMLLVNKAGLRSL